MRYRSLIDDPEALAGATDEARREATFALARQEIERFSSRDTQGAVCDRPAAIEIARAVGARLPSEAEFEWIAREEGHHDS